MGAFLGGPLLFFPPLISCDDKPCLVSLFIDGYRVYETFGVFETSYIDQARSLAEQDNLVLDGTVDPSL